MKKLAFVLNLLSKMNNFSTLFAIIWFGVFASCNKEQVTYVGTGNSKGIIELRSVDTLRAYNCLALVINKDQAHEALAYAISKLVFESSEIRDLLITEMDHTAHGNQDVLLAKIKNNSIHGVTVESMINSSLIGASCFLTTNAVTSILNIDPLVCIKITDDMTDFQWNNTQILGVKAYNDANAKHFYNGEILDGDPNDLVELTVKTSEFNRIINRNTGVDINGVAFEVYFGISYNTCLGLKTQIQNKPDFLTYTGFSLVHSLNDVRSGLDLFCPSSPLPPQGNPIGGEGDCPRVFISTQFPYNTNYLTAMWLENMATFNTIDNQPCIAGPEEEFSFHIQWTYAENSTPIIVKHPFKVLNYSRNQVITEPVYSYSIKEFWSWSCLCHRYILIKTLVTPPSLNYLPCHIELFSNTKVDNSWEPNFQGKFVEVSIKEIDTYTCGASALETHEFNTSGSTNFGVKDLVAFTINWSSGYTYTNSFSITASSTVELGNLQWEYCHPYVDEWKFKSYMKSSTGSVNMFLYAPGIN